MSLLKIGAAARRIAAYRGSTSRAEELLRIEIFQFMDANRGTGKMLAKSAGVTTQHLSDIRHGRRAASDAVVEKLGRLK